MTTILNLQQIEKGYRYNSDTLFLYDFIRQFNPRGKVLDVGCGCGVLGLLIKRDFLIDLYGIDIQDENYKLACFNSGNNKLEGHFICDNFLSHSFEGHFDYIVSNPPFYASQKPRSPLTHLEISRSESYLPLNDFLSKITKLLYSNRGGFFVCYDATRLNELLIGLAQVGLKCADLAFVHPKKEKKATLVMIRAIKNGKHEMKVHPPYIAFDGEVFSQQALTIYDICATHSLT